MDRLVTLQYTLTHKVMVRETLTQQIYLVKNPNTSSSLLRMRCGNIHAKKNLTPKRACYSTCVCVEKV